MRLKDKVAIVTGAAKGIGECIVRLFAQEGAKVIAVDMSDIEYKIENVEGYKLNVTDRDACKSFAAYINEKYKKLNIVVNNAGIVKDALITKMEDKDWDAVINVNLNGIYNIIRPLSGLILDTANGSIINIASVVGEYGNIGQSNYSATKSALYGLSKTWAKEFARKGANIRVNTISPGYVMTDILKTVPEDLLNKFASLTMLKRLGQPIEIAKAALFLASDESSYVTAHNLSVNGGMRL